MWGFGILIFLSSTLFHLDQYVTVSLPIGYLQPLEAVLASMLIAAWLKGSGFFFVRDEAGTLWVDSRRPTAKECWSILAPYCLWQSACCLLGLMNWAGTDHFRFALRFWLSGVLPWLSFYVLAKLSPSDSHRVFKTAYYLTLLTSLIHIGLQITDMRSVMKAAYFWTPQNAAQDFSWMQQWLDKSDFVRGLPQGILLILFFTMLKMAEYVLSRQRAKIWNLLVVVVLFSAVFITVTRSYILALITGLIVFLVLSWLGDRIRFNAAVRLASILLFFVCGALLYNAVRPGFIDFWSERVSQFSGADSRIFSEENHARGLDNLASMRAIADHPLTGIGAPVYPTEYALHDGPPSDTHPMLEVGLVGGLPAMLLVLLLQARLFWPFLKTYLRYPAAANGLLPFLCVMIMNTFAVNLSGGGGTLFGPEVLFVTIFVSEMWNQRQVNLSFPESQSKEILCQAVQG